MTIKKWKKNRKKKGNILVQRGKVREVNKMTEKKKYGLVEMQRVLQTGCLIKAIRYTSGQR